MRSKSYYFYTDGGKGLYKGSRRCEDKPLIINCSGRFVTESHLHTHSLGRADYYLIFILEGALTVNLNGEEASLEGGDFIIFPPGTKYEYSHKGGESLAYYWAHFTGGEVEKILDKYGLPCYPQYGSTGDFNDISRRISSFFEVCASEEKFKDYELSLLFERLLILVARSSGDFSNPLKRSVAHINSYYNTELRIPELAKMENLSVSRYNSIFKSTFGMSPLEYIIKIRLSFACDLLLGTNLSIKEISSQVGYGDPHFFSRIFRASIGISPRDFRLGAEGKI